MSYIPLYIKTDNSLLQSLIKIDDLVAFAKENNIDTLSITDDTMYGAIEFYNKCINNNIKPIIGLEITYNNKIIILYAANSNGYHNLIHLTTINSSSDLKIDDLINYSKDLICLLPYESNDLYEKVKEVYPHLYFTYKNDEESKKTSNSFYMNKILYLDSDDAKYINYLYGIKKGITIDNIEKNDEDFSLKNNIINSNKYNSNNTNFEEFCNLINLKIDFDHNLLPIYKCPDNMDSYAYLKNLCLNGLRKLFGQTVNKMYIDRLKYELSVINQMGFCNYFLIVWDYVNYAKKNNILVGPGRGSAAGSLVSYCLNITTIDPIKYNLLFERFLNPERVTMPDIDIDFEYNKRDNVIKYCINKYGVKKVAPIITFGTLGSKQAIRDIGRVMDINIEIIDYICHMIDSKLTLKDNYNKNNRLQKYIIDNNLLELYKTSDKIEGLKRHTSIHAAGIVMANNDLDNVIPLEYHDGIYLTGYSMEYLESLGLLKMDFLALKNLTLISDVINDINNDLNLNMTFDNIPSDDEETIQIFNKVKTLGIFQFESDGMINFIRKFKPTTFEDIFAAVALFRPGPMHNIDSYIRRKNGSEKIDYFHKDLEKILKPTYGIIIYQEQIMQIANVMAGYSYSEADLLRRAMSKKKESILLKEKEKFISQSVTRGYSKELVTKIYDLILKFASYGFNRAHSVAYAIIAYKMAYLKSHYPVYFMKHLLSMVVGSEIKTKDYIYECKLNNITVLPPDINKSESNYSIEGDNIRYPLSNIKNLGITAVNIILEERKKGSFIDIYDFISRTYSKAINKKALENLIDVGAFSSFSFNKNTLYTNLDIIINYAELIKDVGTQYALIPDIKVVEEFATKELMLIELRAFGFYLSKHPVTEYKLKYNNKVSLINIEKYFDKHIEVIIYIEKIKEIETKNNKKMAFITGSDESANVDLVLFNDVYEQYYDYINTSNIVLITGHVEKRFDKMQIIVSKIEKISV